MVMKMQVKIQPEKLTQIREARELTMTDIARHLGISPAAVQAWESKKAEPKEEYLPVLSELLKVPPVFLQTPYNDKIQLDKNIFFRSLADLPANKRKSAERKVEWVMELVQFIEEYVELPCFDLDNICRGDRCDYSVDEIEELAYKTRIAIGFSADRPISNLTEAIEKAGCIVAEIEIANAVDAFSTKPSEHRPLILLDTLKDSPGRRRFNIAHELGHIIMHRNYRYKRDQRNIHNEVEKQANIFASALLLPKNGFSKRVSYHGSRFNDLLTLKKEWLVSMIAIVHRLRDLNLITHTEAKSYYMKISRLGYRKQEPEDNSIPFERPIFLAESLNLIKELDLSLLSRFQITCGLPSNDLNSLVGEKVFDEHSSYLKTDEKIIHLFKS